MSTVNSLPVATADSLHIHFDTDGLLKKLFVCFVALCPKSTAMVMAGYHIFMGKLEQAVHQYFVHILLFVTDKNHS